MKKSEISAEKFKQDCLSLMREVAEKGVELVITKRGVPLCRLVPLKPEQTVKRVGWMEGTITFSGDITQPTGED